VVEVVSTTENYYESKDDDGIAPVGAFEMKSKLKSRDAI